MARASPEARHAHSHRVRAHTSSRSPAKRAKHIHGDLWDPRRSAGCPAHSGHRAPGARSSQGRRGPTPGEVSQLHTLGKRSARVETVLVSGYFETPCSVERLVRLPTRVSTKRAADDPAPGEPRERQAEIRDVRRAARAEIELE